MADKIQFEYLRQESDATLREGIAELRAAEVPGDDLSVTVAPELVADLEMHDAIHVVFGCSTTLPGEILAHAWTAFGTTATIKDLHRVVAHRDHSAVVAAIGHWRLLGLWACSVPRLIRTIAHARRMLRAWPAKEFASYMDRPLKEIRAEFGIRVVSQGSDSGSRPRPAGAALRSVRRGVLAHVGGR